MEPASKNDCRPRRRTLGLMSARVIAAFLMAVGISFRGLTTETYNQERIRQVLVDSENAIAPRSSSLSSSSSNGRLLVNNGSESVSKSKSNLRPNTTVPERTTMQRSSAAGRFPANKFSQWEPESESNPPRNQSGGPDSESFSESNSNLPPTQTRLEQKKMQQARLGLSNIRFDDDSDIDLDIDFDLNVSTLKLLYLHVGKTGGTSLDKVLRENCKQYWATGGNRKKCETNLLVANHKPKPKPYTGNDKNKANGDELLLSKVVKKTMHTKRSRNMEPYLSHRLLWTVRNPIDRAVSAFDMRHADNDRRAKEGFDTQWIFYKLCGFGTAQDLADVLEFETNSNNTAETNNTNSTHPRIIKVPKDSTTNETDDLDCHEFGKDTLEGYGDKSHLYFNYAYYTRYVQDFPKDTTNFVLRTEHLWDDVIQTNGLLTLAEAAEASNLTEDGNHRENATKASASPPPPPLWISKVKDLSDHKRTHGSEAYKVKSKLTKRGREVFCCCLSDENKIYEDLLRSAVNLSDRQKSKGLESLYRDCGILPFEPLDGVNETAWIAASSSSSSNISSSGFGWKEWRSKGCPRHTSAQMKEFFPFIT